MSDTVTVWGEIQGREITFPMEVTNMNAATLLFSVPSGAAAALLPGDAFEVVEVAPGTAQLVVTFLLGQPLSASPRSSVGERRPATPTHQRTR